MTPKVPPDVEASFRDAMARLASGVAVVTTCDPDELPKGFTATSVTPYSASPPSVLVCVGRTATTYEPLTRCDRFAVHLLAEGQEPLAVDFARTDSRKFELHDWSAGAHGVPILDGVMAVVACRTDAVWEHGDHAAVVGAVEDVSTRPVAPLVYFGRRFHSLPADVAPASEPSFDELLKLILLG